MRLKLHRTARAKNNLNKVKKARVSRKHAVTPKKVKKPSLLTQFIAYLKALLGKDWRGKQSLKRLGKRINEVLSHRITTLTFEEGMIRVLVFRAGKVLAWHTVTQESRLVGTAQGQVEEPGSEKPDNNDTGADASARELQALLKELHASRRRIIIDLPPIMTLMRQIKVPKVGRRYRNRVLLSDILDNVPFSPEEVDVSWHLEQNGTKDTAFATVVPKEAIDSRMKVLRSAGIRRPAAVYTRALALALASGASDGIVIHGGPSRISLVLISQNVPQLFHETRLQLQEQAFVIAKAVEQVISHYESIEGAKDTSTMPVVLTGLLSGNSQLAKEMEDVLHRPVQSSIPQVEYPQDFPVNEFTANLGLALAERANRIAFWKKATGNVSSANLLPQRHRPRSLPVLPTVIFASLLVLGYGATIANDKLEAAQSKAEELSEQYDVLQGKERQSRLSLAQKEAEEKRLKATSQVTLALKSRQADSESKANTLLMRLGTITSKSSPDTLRLSTLDLQGDDILLSGKSTSYEEVLKFTESIRQSGLFTSVSITRADMGAQSASGSVTPTGDDFKVAFLIKVVPISKAQSLVSAIGQK